MGYYLPAPSRIEKVQYFISQHGAELLFEQPKSFSEVPAGKALICVVSNGPFEAAGFLYSENEFKAFRS